MRGMMVLRVSIFYLYRYTNIFYTKFIFNLVFRITVHVGHKREWALKFAGAQLKSEGTISEGYKSSGGH